jgi:hypothetical protein
MEASAQKEKGGETMSAKSKDDFFINAVPLGGAVIIALAGVVMLNLPLTLFGCTLMIILWFT